MLHRVSRFSRDKGRSLAACPQPIPAPAAAPDFTVVIRTYTERRWEDLVEAVRSVHAQTTPPREIVVVVDHNPALLERVRHRWPNVIAVENADPQGASGSMNAGIAAAQGSVIAFLDDDAVASPDWLEQMAPAYADGRVLVVGGKIDPIWANGKPYWFPEEFNWVVGCTYPGLPTDRAHVRNLIGANMSFRRWAAEAVGGFRNGVGAIGDSPLRGEDTEFCIRVRQRWGPEALLYEPRARVEHRQHAARARWGYFCSMCYAQGQTKALIARLLGRQDGLSSEWSYAVQTLPLGVLRSLGSVVRRGEPAGVVRAGAIVAGLVLTTAGYVMSSLTLPPDYVEETPEQPEAVSFDAAG